MPKATVTVRELKNKDTGIDLAVTDYKEIPGLMLSTYEFQVVIVTNLSCFKLPSHKESDVVQFTIYKKFTEFEELRNKLNETFAGTVFPPIVKKSIIVSDAVIKERRASLDIFLKFLASMPRIITSSLILTFLGLDPLKAKRFASGETEEAPSQEHVKTDIVEENEDGTLQDERSSKNLFEDEDAAEADGNAFEISDDTTEVDFNTDSDFFGDSTFTSARLFESPDLKRELTEEDEQAFSFIPDAIIKKHEVFTVTTNEDTEDLLTIEDNLDQLLSLGSGDHKGHAQEQATNRKPEKPEIPSKPNPPLQKPKPPIPSKPKPGSITKESKPSVLEKPKPAPRKLRSQGAQPELKTSLEDKKEPKGDNSSKGTDLSQDDIMNYIAANTAADDADLDLFS